jgi:hypothetical protein
MDNLEFRVKPLFTAEFPLRSSHLKHFTFPANYTFMINIITLENSQLVLASFGIVECTFNSLMLFRLYEYSFSVSLMLVELLLKSENEYSEANLFANLAFLHLLTFYNKHVAFSVNFSNEIFLSEVIILMSIYSLRNEIQ